MSILRFSNLSLYIWMLGATIMLAGVASGLENPEGAAHLYGLGSLLMIAGLVMPPVHGAINNLQTLWRRRQSSGGDQA